MHAVFHYVPLHSAPAGRTYGRAHGQLRVTDDIAGRLVRLPMFPDLTSEQVEHVITSAIDALAGVSTAR